MRYVRWLVVTVAVVSSFTGWMNAEPSIPDGIASALLVIGACMLVSLEGEPSGPAG
jgi:hypothetical protein